METQTLPAWEERFFAGIELAAAEDRAKEAARIHETAAHDYVDSLGKNDREKVIVARTNLSHSLRRFHATQRNLKNAKAKVANTHTVTVAQ